MKFAALVVLLCAALLPGCRPGPAAVGAVGAGSGVRFVDTAAQMGLDYRWGNGGKHPLNILEIMGAGAGFLDYDGDGWPDILLIGNGRCALYHNEHGSRMKDVTPGSGFDRLSGRWHGMAVGDYDNDGRPDVFLTGYRQKVLLHNEGSGRFAPVSVPALDTTTWGSAASFLDANGDGYLDLVAGNYVKFGTGSPEFMLRNGVKITLGPDAYEGEKLQLLINEGGRRFRDATHESGVDVTRGRCLGIAVGDYDADGHDDFYVANDEMPANLFHGDGRGHFRDVGPESGTSVNVQGKRQGGMGVCWGDYNNDLRTDLFVTTFTQEPKSLYRNDGSGFFSERSYEAGISQSTLRWVGFGVSFLDYDNDGDLDLAFVNGHVEDLIHQVDPLNDYAQPIKLFRNKGDGTFADVSESAGPGFQRQIVGRALAVADFDRDGDPDLLAADLEGAPLLLRNEGDGQPGHWLMLQLTGTRSNQMALGARVEIQAGGARQMREVRTDGSYLSAHDPTVHFGLGAASEADEIRIRWPSGVRQRLTHVRADQLLHVQEPRASGEGAQ